jgi:Flp pilus assembly protein TadD
VRIGSYGVWGAVATVGLWLTGLAVAQDGSGTLPGSTTPPPAAGSSFGDGVKNGWNKFTQAITPEPHVNPAPDATALATPAKAGPELYVAIGRVAEQQLKFDQAEEQYQRALTLDGKHLGALMAMARLRDRQNRFDEALQFYHQALKAYPKEAGVFNDLGLCLAKRQMYPDSITAMRKAIQLQPQKPLYHNNLASVLVENGDMEGAYAQLRAVHDEPEAYYDLGYLMFLKGNRQAAAALFTKALQEKPSLTEAKLFLEKLGPVRPAQPAAQPRYSQPIDQPAAATPAAQQRYSQPNGQSIAPSPVTQQRYPEPVAQPYYPERGTRPDESNSTAQPRNGEPTVQPRYPDLSRPAGPMGPQSDGVPNTTDAASQAGRPAFGPYGPPNESAALMASAAAPGSWPVRPLPQVDPRQGDPSRGPEMSRATSLPRLPSVSPQGDGPGLGSREVPYMASRMNVQPGPSQSSPPAAQGPSYDGRLPGNVVPLPPVHENDPGL